MISGFLSQNVLKDTLSTEVYIFRFEAKLMESTVCKNTSASNETLVT